MLVVATYAVVLVLFRALLLDTPNKISLSYLPQRPCLRTILSRVKEILSLRFPDVPHGLGLPPTAAMLLELQLYLPSR